jgi:hypothetical protein
MPPTIDKSLGLDLLARFRRMFEGEWLSVTGFSVGYSVGDGLTHYKLKAHVSCDLDLFPSYDRDRGYGDVECWGKDYAEVLAAIERSLDDYLIRARRCRLWHEQIIARRGEIIIFKGRHYRTSPDLKDHWRADRFRVGTDYPGNWTYHDFPPSYIAAEHNREIPPGTRGRFVNWSKGYMQVDAEGFGLVWVPAWFLQTSCTDANRNPIAGTEHVVFADNHQAISNQR